jgi:hypothetical protein
LFIYFVPGKRDIGEFFYDLWTILQKIGANLVNKFNEIFAQIIYTLSSTWESAKPLFEELLSNIKDEWNNINFIVNDQLFHLQQIIQNFFNSLGESISSTIQSLKHSFNQFIQILANKG